MLDMVTIHVNGDVRDVPKGLNVAQLIAHLGLTANRLAIEHNSEIIRRAQWEETLVSGGDRFEIVHLVGGG